MKARTFEEIQAAGPSGLPVVVTTDQENAVHVPKSLKPCLTQHDYRPVKDEAGETRYSYVRTSPAFEDGKPLFVYPKMLFHPDWHKEPAPELHECADGADYEVKRRRWAQKFDRTIIATDAKHEARLVKKGWLVKPPVQSLADPASDVSEDI